MRWQRNGEYQSIERSICSESHENVKAVQMNELECWKMDLRGVTDEGISNTKFELMLYQNFLHKILLQK